MANCNLQKRRLAESYRSVTGTAPSRRFGNTRLVIVVRCALQRCRGATFRWQAYRVLPERVTIISTWSGGQAMNLHFRPQGPAS